MSSEQPNKKSLRKSNQKALPRKQQLQDDIVASDIASKLQMGVSELEIFADLLEQQIPMDEIQSAFSKAGMDENGFNSLVQSYEQAMQQQQQQQAMPDYAMPQMQYGGSAFFPLNISQGNRMKGVDYVAPTGTYLPEDLGNRGNVLGAFATLAEGAADLFGGKDRDGDGLMDGAFRDSQAKRRAFKRGKASQFDYTDSFGDPIGGGEYSDEELFKASKDETYIPRKEKDLLKEYSRFGMDEQGKLQAFLTDRPFDKRDYTKQKDSPYYRNKLEDLYSGMKPAGEFDFNPFIKAAQEEKQAEKESEVRAQEAVQERKTPSVAAEEAVVKQKTNPVVQSKPTTQAADYSYLDDPISQILDFEGSLGGFDPNTGKAYGLTNLGANRYTDLDPNSSTYRQDLTQRIKQDYAPSLSGFAREAQPAMLDYAYNTGRDPRIYMLDAYLKGQGQKSGLANRIAYKDAMDNYSWDDQALKKQFNTEYARYADAIGTLSGQEQLDLMNQARNFYYNNLNQINGQPNPAAQATWLQRPFYKRGGDLVKYQGGTEVDEDGDGIPDYNMLPEVVITANSQLPKIDPLPMRKLPSIASYMPETLEFIDEPELDPQIGSIERDRKPGSRMRRFLDSPGVDKFSSAANFGVAAAGVANEMFQNKRALDAERELDLKTADDLYGTYEEREGDRGMYDVNTGIAQPDNLDIGYAMHGMEVPMMNTGMPKLDMNQEIDLDMETITKLIAAGADIEIL